MVTTAHTNLMFQNGRTEEAIRSYERIFDGDFTIESVSYFDSGDMSVDELRVHDATATDPAGKVQLATCSLAGQRVTCFDSPIRHPFDMTAAMSLCVECRDDAEIERLFSALADEGEVAMPLDDYGFARRYGWLIDRFGVLWQLTLP